jgi:prepilin-type N-terminal cleavage/methylation domain-containing protein/prepilin-type processing-associated H-X9-DG protein
MTDRPFRLGFTLIEVLAVLAILAVLVAMLLPSLAGSSKSKLIHCMNNQKQIALATIIYAEDSKGLFPNLDYLPGNDGPAALTLLSKYLGHQTNTFMCPLVVSQRESDRPWYRARFVPELNAAYFRSNGNDYAYYDGLLPRSPTNAILADRFAWTNRSVATKTLANHFGGRINAAFADGHAETLRPDRILGTNLTPAWSAVQDPLRRP